MIAAMSENVAGIVLAGGTGVRVGGETPKQFIDLDGYPMVQHCLNAFDACADVGSIILVIPDGFGSADVGSAKLTSVITGGDTRQASLGQGLIALPDEAEIVVVHDAARPLIRPSLISKAIAELTEGIDGVIAAIPMEDAVKEVSLARQVLRSRSRDGLWRVQTPQVFRRDVLEEALASADAAHFLGDDCADLVVRVGGVVVAVAGDPWNIKVTFPSDVAIAEQVLAVRRASSRLKA